MASQTRVQMDFDINRKSILSKQIQELMSEQKRKLKRISDFEAKTIAMAEQYASGECRDELKLLRMISIVSRMKLN